MIDRLTLESVHKAIPGSHCQGDALFSRISTDTRSLQPGDLFVALSGPNFDGNRFVAQAAEKGACGAVVSSLQPGSLPQLVVDDVLLALGRIAQMNRQRFQGPLVAITGSSGKTSVKEMLAAILSRQGAVLATKGNLNNAIGVPLTLLDIGPADKFAVIEMGASGPNEIAYSAGLAYASVAILTNAGGAHLEGFGDLMGVVRAKGEIFDGLADSGIGVVNLDDANARYWLDRLGPRRARTFSLVSAHADIFASHIETGSDGCCSFVLNSHDDQIAIDLQVMGRHSIANALAAASAARVLGVSLADIQAGLGGFRGVKGRLQPHRCASGLRVIDDTYNANPESIRAAIRVLSALPGPRCLMLGDMAELGEQGADLHTGVGRYAAEQGVNTLLACGSLSCHTLTGFNTAGGENGAHFADRSQLLASEQFAQIVQEQPGQSVVLVKGSRSAGMENVVQMLLNEDNRSSC